MTIQRKLALAALLIGAAGAAWFTARAWHAKSTSSSPFEDRLTLDYSGPASGLFDALTRQTGIRYVLDPALSARPVHVAAHALRLVEIQDQAAKQAGLRYSPADQSGKAVRVSSAR